MDSDNEFTEKRAGASRAVLKKRKKLEKIKQKASSGQSIGYASDSDQDHLPASGSKLKKAKREQANLFHRLDVLGDCSFTSPLGSLSSILALQDPDEATCHQKAALVISKLTYPVSHADFYFTYWEVSPLLSEHSGAEYFGAGFFPSKKTIRTLIKSHVWDPETLKIRNQHNELIDFAESIPGEDVTKKYLHQNHTLVLLQPQIHDDHIWQLLSCLEFEFNCRISCHIYYSSIGPSAVGSVDVDADCFVVQLDGSATFTTTVEASPGSAASRQYKLHPGSVLYLPATEQLSFTPIHAKDGKEQKQQTKTAAAPSAPVTLFMVLTVTKTHTRIADLLHLSLSQAVYIPGDVDEGRTSTRSVLLKSLPVHVQSTLGVSAHSDEDDEGVDADAEQESNAVHGILSKVGLERLIMQELEKAMQEVVKKALTIIHPAADQVGTVCVNTVFLYPCIIIIHMSIVF